MSYEDLCSTIVHYNDDLFRNIKGIIESQNLFDDLMEDDADFDVAVAASEFDRIESSDPMISRPFEYGIGYPFDAKNWQETRFSTGRDFGVWYGSESLETTFHETVFHWVRFILSSYASENRTITADRRVVLVKCEGLLIKLLGKESDYPDLVNRKNYSFCQGLGEYLVDQGQSGLLVRSARHDGTNAAIFEKNRLSNVRDFCFLTYTMNPTSDRVQVRRTTGERWIVPASPLFEIKRA